MNEKLRIGVIGCDEISWKARCPGIVAAKNAEYAMVSNIREELAKELSLEYVPVNLANRHLSVRAKECLQTADDWSAREEHGSSILAGEERWCPIASGLILPIDDS